MNNYLTSIVFIEKNGRRFCFIHGYLDEYLKEIKYE